ncbi:MAG: YggT family protein [Rhodospirillales bacterium]|nr:YggT family protein [Rhodospirillales bacterium]MCW8971322.1 YggT family protein [Rhodospirillales bacterium]MCW9002687.1 YggT family protein [Rhodospirillales bacterium]MCW9040892.1 YggT family protein [Rhodospirillales bacterium]
MDVILVPLIQMIATVIDLYIWILIIGVVLSWLTAFNVVNMSNRFVYLVSDFIYRVTEPALRPIRRFIPNLGGVDLSPLVLILGLYMVQGILFRLAFRFA